MYYSEPNEKVHVLPWDFKVFELVPVKSDVIIHVLNSKMGEEEVKKAQAFFSEREISMISLVAKFENFQEFISSYLYTFKQNCDIIIMNPGTKKDFIPFISKLTLKNFRFVMPLRSDSDRLNIKILSSAGVQALIDMRDPKLDWTQLDDLITDQLLSIAPRAVLEPFAMLSKVYKTKEFDLSTVYYSSPVDFIPYDPRTGKFNNVNAEDFEKSINEKIIKTEKCSFCEGFSICKSFLERYNGGSYEKCSGFFKNIFDTIEIKVQKDEKAPLA